MTTTKDISQNGHNKTCGNSEKITLEKKLTIERSFTTEPKRFRIKRGHTIVSKRCKDVMESLYKNHKLKETCDRDTLENEIFLCAGGDYRTIRKYLGFCISFKNGGRKKIKGYLERLRFIETVNPKLFLLNHWRVNRPYHYQESLSPNPPLPTFDEIQDSHRKNVCVQELADENVRGCGVEAKASILIKNNNNNNTHTNQLSESILTPKEKLILELARATKVLE